MSNKYERYENGVLVEHVACTQQELLQNQLLSIRSIRAPLLSEADAQVNKHMDVSHTNLGAWRTYRQELRYVPQQADINNVTWPTKPPTLPKGE